MPTIKLDLDQKTYRILTALAVDERRPVCWQAEVVLRRALGTFASLPDPCPAKITARENDEVPCATE